MGKRETEGEREEGREEVTEGGRERERWRVGGRERDKEVSILNIHKPIGYVCVRVHGSALP